MDEKACRQLLKPIAMKLTTKGTKGTKEHLQMVFLVPLVPLVPFVVKAFLSYPTHHIFGD